MLFRSPIEAFPHGGLLHNAILVKHGASEGMGAAAAVDVSQIDRTLARERNTLSKLRPTTRFDR